ncbi:MAG TPA: hypothetical protein VEL31_27675, partial [Ktedonobacteraceae bacterium]|nr:hypothetical protein [Ktedonobacteraceae bacterium]
MATQAVQVSTRRLTLRDRLDLGNGYSPYLLVLPTVIMVLAVAGYPIINSIWLSLLDNPLSPSAQFVGLANYGRLFTNSEFRGSIG